MWVVAVLLWKHLLVRKRNYKRSLLEYLLPLLYFAFIYYLSHLMLRAPIHAAERTEPLMYDELLRQHQQGSILFTPDTRFTNQLMDEVGEKLDLRRLDYLPTSGETGYFPISSEMILAVMNYSKEVMTSKDAIVIFEDMESYEWPKRLTYTIRMKNDVEDDPSARRHVRSFWPFNMDHHEKFGTRHEAFMRLQWAIDTSYLRLQTGADVQQTLALQELPGEMLDGRYVLVCVIAGLLLPLAIGVTYSHLAQALSDGKNNGMHEILKMSGVSWEALAVSHVIDQVPSMLIYVAGGALLYKFGGLLRHTDSGYIAIALALHFMSVVALAFAMVYAFNINQNNRIFLVIVYYGSLIAGIATLKHLICAILLPHAPFNHFWVSVGIRETIGAGITNIWERYPHEIVTVAEVYLLLLIQTLFLAMVAWYFSKVRPGNYGQALPWNFLFIKDYWRKNPKVGTAPMEPRIVSEEDQQYFEKTPVDLPAGIEIVDVYKSFGKDTVLHGVNLTVYSGEITVLLGHNGAGKTTLINIITGLISATSGRVLVEGKDTVMQAKEVRKLIGLCTQENVFFEELTAFQHVMFFAMLKGKSCAQARVTATEVLAKLKLSDKAKAVPEQLSGGMKRRLQFACAVAGGARVLMLDEPTSGLDVETRRELWDLLLSLRGDRTVLLTTHFMEEADALGDRIAALHHGRVRCYASPMFLKRAIGSGYRLSLTTTGAPREEDITSVIAAAVPDATARDKLPNSITYNLPAKDMARFPKLFAALEDKRSELGIETIGVGKSTLEDVFVKLCSDEKLSFTELDTPKEPAREKVTGAKLYGRQFVALLFRQWRYLISSIISLIAIVIIILFVLWLYTETNNNAFGQELPTKLNTTVSLDLEAPERPERALVKADVDTLEALRMGFSGVTFEPTFDVESAVPTRKDDQEYLIEIKLSDTIAKALYTTTVRHAAPVAVNALSNALAARMRASDDEPVKFTARYHPLRGAYVPYHESELKQPKDELNLKMWSTNILMICLLCLTTLVRLPYIERAAGTRHALVLAGAPRVLLWSAALLAHGLLAAMIFTLPTIIFAATVEKDSTINQHGFLLALCVLLMLGFLAFLTMLYWISTMAQQTAAFALMISCVILCTNVTPQIPESAGVLYKLAEVVYVLMPPHAAAAGMLRAAAVARVNAHCNLNRDKCPALDLPQGFQTNECCDSPPGSEPFSYWSSHSGAGWAPAVLAGQAVAYFLLTLVVDDGALARLQARLSRAAPPPLHYDDGAVRAEAEYVATAIKMSTKQMTDAILCHNLQKNFRSRCGCCGKSFFAVKGLSFSVKKGECFGLLGVNGAGKSTTFSMLTRQAVLTGGDIYANGYRVGDGVAYMRTFSYCPQFGGVEGYLTGRQNLALLLTMRGLHATSVAAVTAYWLEEVDLSKDADKRVSSYSGGMARRLAAAAALCQAAPTAVLDEPTAGVDPLARRHMHVALMRARQNRSFIIASHSMDEMEALCHRIAIMSGGEVRALGSVAALKAQFGKGYTVVFKLSIDQAADGADGKLEEFKSQVYNRFDCELRDEHRGMLSYYFKESLRYSELFSQLEQLREQFPMLEDYTVTEATLEEVFLVLAKETHEAKTPAATTAPNV